jgi:transcriptional regulator with XRE-family HTH domain
MDRKKLNAGQLEYMTGVSQSMIWNLQNDKRPNVSAVIVAKLAEALECSIEFLLDVSPQALAEGKAPYNVAHLDEKQRAILDFFESLSDDEQEFVLEMAEFVRSRNTPRIIG